MSVYLVVYTTKSGAMIKPTIKEFPDRDRLTEYIKARPLDFPATLKMFVFEGVQLDVALRPVMEVKIDLHDRDGVSFLPRKPTPTSYHEEEEEVEEDQ